MSAQPLAPPGWYPQGDSLRYWDGASWTEHIAPKLVRTGPDVLLIVGYIFAVIFPLAGIVIGGFVLSRDDRGSRWHGWWIIGLSVLLFCLELAISIAETNALG